MPLRLAMWSGPRNISTAMMRSWGNRPDTVVVDEPLYAYYLLKTHAPHPGAAEVIAHHETNWHRVIETLTGPVPYGRAVYYQKHMTHHLLPHIDRSWLGKVTNVFLIRDPAEVIRSLSKNLPKPTLTDTGIPQQEEIYRWVCENTGQAPPILDARDVLNDPRRYLSLLCARLDVPFDEHMLAWPAGRRDTDGIWAKHWYAEVEKSTGFQPYRPRTEPLSERLRGLCERCWPHYEALYQKRLGLETADAAEL